MAKRKLDKISIHDVKTYDSAIEHGMITELSPVKKVKKDENAKYFVGQ